MNQWFLNTLGQSGGFAYAALLLTSCATIVWIYKQTPRIRNPRILIFLQIGLVVSCVLGFSILAAQLSSTSLIALDSALSAELKANISKPLRYFFEMETHLGDKVTLWSICVVACAGLLYTGHYRLAALAVVAIAGNGVFNDLLKDHFHRLRPPDAGLASWSFPSGHTSGSVVAYGFLSYVAIRLLPTRYHLYALVLATVIAITTGTSRIFIGRHYVLDVLAGFTTGLSWLFLSVLILEATVKSKLNAKEDEL